MASQKCNILYGRFGRKEDHRSKETSKMVRAIKKMQAEWGERLGGKPLTN